MSEDLMPATASTRIRQGADAELPGVYRRVTRVTRAVLPSWGITPRRAVAVTAALVAQPVPKASTDSGRGEA